MSPFLKKAMLSPRYAGGRRTWYRKMAGWITQRSSSLTCGKWRTKGWINDGIVEKLWKLERWKHSRTVPPVLGLGLGHQCMV